jgi:hypothetical protein
MQRTVAQLLACLIGVSAVALAVTGAAELLGRWLLPAEFLAAIDACVPRLKLVPAEMQAILFVLISVVALHVAPTLWRST